MYQKNSVLQIPYHNVRIVMTRYFFYETISYESFKKEPVNDLLRFNTLE